MLSELFTSVADALISYAIDKLDPAERIKSWLKQDPARIAFQKALARAYSAFARQYPEYTSSLFDQSFLSKEALPELSKLLTRSQHPVPALLAQAWGQSIGADADFAQAATKPASYFIERLEAELKAEPALQGLFDSRASESLPKLEAEIQKLTTELQRGLDTALKAASDYQKVTLHIEGDVKDSNIIIGDNNVINKYYYSGDFVSLNEYYIPPDGVFQRVRVDEFVGRDWLTAKVDAFLNDPSQKSGAFLLVGDAGVGKTAFMAHLVKERRYLHLFAEQVPGQAMLQRALQSLGSQLVTRYQIDPYKDRDTLNVLAGFPDFLERLLRLAASTLTEGEKIVIVCDALDEAGVFPDHFVFGLPKELPDGVYLILSQRPVNTKLPNFEPLRFDLEAQGEDNLQDMQDYLSAVARRPAVMGQIRAKDYSEDFFIQTLKEKSLGVWMYLHYVIKEIERGQRAPLDLESLPKGLVGYYADYWDNWRSGPRGSDAAKWDSLYAPLLATLAAAQEAITVEKLIEWADVQASPSEVTRLLNESWSSFITEKEEKGKTFYTLYHQSLRDFITGKVEDIKKLSPSYASLVNELSKKKVEAHQRIVNAFDTECNGKWEKLVEQDYPRLHLTAHLNGAKEYKKLTDLLTEGDEKIKWAEVREKKEETYAGYLNDLTYVWDYAEREQNYALAIRCMLIENSIHSLASNIPPKLLAELGKAGIWSYARCLSSILENSHTYAQAEALELIIADLPPLLFQEALAVARKIKDEYHRAVSLFALAAHVTDKLKAQVHMEAMAATREFKKNKDIDEDEGAFALSYLAPYLNSDLKIQVLVAVCNIKDLRFRVIAFSNLAPDLSDELKIRSLQEILAAASDYGISNEGAEALSALAPHLSDELKKQALVSISEFKDTSFRTHALSALAPHLADELKPQALQEALTIAREMKEAGDRARTLASLAPHLGDELKLIVIQEALESTGKNEHGYITALTLSMLAPYLTDELKMRALSIAREIEDEFYRIRALSDLAFHLTGEPKLQVLQEALAAAHEIKVKPLTGVLSVLAPNLSNEVKTEALDAIREISVEDARSSALSALAPHLITNEHKTKALSIAHEIISKNNRVDALIALVPHLADELKTQVLQDALATAYEIQGITYRGIALTALAPYLADEIKAQVLQGVLAAMRETSTYIHIIALESLASLVPHLTIELKAKVLAAIYEEDESIRKGALSVLAPHLNDELKMLALSIAREIKGKFYRTHALSALVPHLTGELKMQVLQEALAAAHEIQNEEFRVMALIALIPHLADEHKTQVLQDALATAHEIQEKTDRGKVLTALVPHLADELKTQVLQDALATAHEIQEITDRGGALIALVQYLDRETQITLLQDLLYTSNIFMLDELLSAWKEIGFEGFEKNIVPFIKFVSQEDRNISANVIYAIIPALIHFRGPEIADEIYRAITDVTRWWP